jgi:hypothetical protein
MVNYQMAVGSPAYDRGLGLHEFCLAPRIEVIALLGLRPETPALRHVLIDAGGPALVCRQWRSYLIHAGDYGPLVPAIQGADLIVRPDLFDILEETIGADRLGLGLVVRHREAPEPDDEADDQ